MNKPKAKYRTEVYAYETTPYCTKKVEGGWVVYQSWWGKELSNVFATEAEAQDEVVKVARENGSYRPLRRKVRID